MHPYGKCTVSALAAMQLGGKVIATVNDITLVSIALRP